MQRRELEALSKAQLVELCLAQQAAIERLEARVAELERQLNKTSRNSHKPPSSDGYRKATSPTRREQEAAGRSPGGQPGHEGHTLEMVAQADQEVELWPEACRRCGCELESADGRAVSRAQVFELPPVKLEVTEYVVMEQECPGCGECCRGRLPEGVVPGAQYGSRIKGAMTYLHVQNLMPLDRTRQALADLLGASVSEGTIVACTTAGAEHLAPVMPKIQQAIVGAPVAHFDETGMRVNGRLQWLHTASTENVTYYTVDPKRGRQAHARIDILPQFEGTAVHDGYESYQVYDCDHQLCNAHHLRELTAIHESTGQDWAKDMADLLRQTWHRRKQRAGPLTAFQQKHVRRRYRALITRGWRANPFDLRTVVAQLAKQKSGRLKRSPAQNLLKRLDANQDDVLRFMAEPDVPFDNNLAERDLRMMKVRQKVSGCFRTEHGARAFCDLRSYISTIRKQGIGVLDALTSLFDGSPIMPDLGSPPLSRNFCCDSLLSAV